MVTSDKPFEDWTVTFDQYRLLLLSVPEITYLADPKNKTNVLVLKGPEKNYYVRFEND